MADVRFLPSSSHATFLLLLRRQSQQHHRLSRRRGRQLPRRSFSSPRLSSVLYLRRSRPWDSNVESYSSQNFNFNNNDSEGESGNGDGYENGLEQWGELLEGYIDSIWIFKVFGSFGWMLPPILMSLLLATGLKAFLITLALPLSQSTVGFALQKMQNKGKNSPKPKSRKPKKKGRRRAYSSSRKGRFDEEEEWDTVLRARTKKKAYQSWASKNDLSVSSSDRNGASYGGWDELDTGIESNLGSSRTRESSGLRRNDSEKGKLSSGWSKNNTPSLLRLVISIFPFLSSWSKLL